MTLPADVIVKTEDVSSPSLAEELISPVTTDSMVTVPLSDRQSLSESIATDLDSPTTPIDEKADQGSFMETATHMDLTPKSELTGRVVETSITGDIKRSSSVSNEANNIQDGYESSSSTESAGGVDWEKLDKSEEQEPRTEGTDEVSSTELDIERNRLTLGSPRRCYWPVSSRRIMRLRRTRNQGSQKPIESLAPLRYNTCGNLSTIRTHPYDTLNYSHRL